MTIMDLDLNATQEEIGLVREILENMGFQGEEKIQPTMDLIICHRNGCPLDLAKMAEYSRNEGIETKIHVIHDLTGIRNHLDPSTGRLDGRFHPRFAK